MFQNNKKKHKKSENSKRSFARVCSSVFFFCRLGNKCSGNDFTCSPLSTTSDPDADDDPDVGDSFDDKHDEKGFAGCGNNEFSCSPF